MTEMFDSAGPPVQPPPEPPPTAMARIRIELQPDTYRNLHAVPDTDTLPSASLDQPSPEPLPSARAVLRIKLLPWPG
jgi:hypothetical protein